MKLSFAFSSSNGIFFLVLIFGCASEDNEIETILRELEIMPDILQELPKEFLQVFYPRNLAATKGIELTPTQTRDPPKLAWSIDAFFYYTVIMITPDYPSRKGSLHSEWLHWLVVNVPDDEISQGEVICPYIGPKPPKDKGLLRYLICVFKQTEFIIFDEKPITEANNESHHNFDITNFSTKYGMGAPQAMNVFQAKWDEYVPILEKKFMEQ